jgi:CubicO group peptidase (beta-lactamase class C family)
LISLARVALSIAALGLAGGAVADSREQQARAILAEHFDADGPGAAVAVVRGGRSLIATAYGLADVDTGTPLTPRSVFDLASVSKQFTASAILALAADGKLELDGDVSEYVEDFEVEPEGRAVTISDLLHHTSGLANYTSEDYEDGDDAFERVTTETHLVWLNGTEPRQAPGVEFDYNNTNYALLALVIERVSGMSYEAFLSQRLFRPAGMRSTQVMDRPGERIAGAVAGYATAEGLRPSSLRSEIPGDGNVFTSVDDLIAWSRALDGDAVLSRELQRTLWTNGELDDGSPIDADEEGYGCGWTVAPDESGVWHSGAWYGTATFIARRHRDGLWVIVLSNDEDAAVQDIAHALVDLVD